jgi:hypothetical protein
LKSLLCVYPKVGTEQIAMAFHQLIPRSRGEAEEWGELLRKNIVIAD